ncbi:DNA-binding CsgD family transcriptional regulator [Fontibacillus solani]|uniref:DNA-binding CsgD family transcriptional regulator n=1 Tax=Fontibacillus solani TaxID=1572857 RepID=A0A7W3STD7_9BACL|nr:hypothetical protein [Fontibacillus solani]MBA9085764.1 DNA-binding CsgD family transcriptional regulator [Fontibacillus solani]
MRNVWWPLFECFDDLHPEYEIPDWRGRSYFGDFAYLPDPLKFMIEIKGYGPHVRDMDRVKYTHELNRELYLQSLGFRVIAIAYDDVEQRPELCRHLLKMMFSRFQPQNKPIDRSTISEKEIIRLALSSSLPISPKLVSQHLSINYRTSVRLLQSLCTKGWLAPIPSCTGQRIHHYRLVKGSLDFIDL